MKKPLASPPAAFSFDAISFDDGSLAVTTVRFLAVVITGLALIAPGAHVFELLRKMAMSEQQYYVVQDIYRGWWVVGLLLPAALIANVALAVAVRADLTARARDRGGGADPAQSRGLRDLDTSGEFHHG